MPRCLGSRSRGAAATAQSTGSITLTLGRHVYPPHASAEDRICGTIDIEKALTEGIKAYEPGLLARANRGIL